MQIEFATQPPLSVSSHSSISLHTLGENVTCIEQQPLERCWCIKKVLSQLQSVHWDGPACWQWRRQCQCLGPEGRWTLQDRSHSESPVKCWCSEHPCDTAWQNTAQRARIQTWLRQLVGNFGKVLAALVHYVILHGSSFLVFSSFTSSTSVQWLPLPCIPSGHDPHCTPWGVSMHSTPGWQGLGTQEGRRSIPPIPGHRANEPVKSRVTRTVFVCCSRHTHHRLHTPSLCSSRTQSPLSARQHQLNDGSLHCVLAKVDLLNW